MKEKSEKSRVSLLIGILMLAAAAAWLLLRMLGSPAEVIGGGTNEQRIEYIESFGWSVGLTHCDVREIRIPVEFDDVYEKYNALQREQGFDLRKYRAHSVKKYTYEISKTDDDPVPLYASLLVENDIIIGADVTSAESGSAIGALAISG